MKRTPSGIAPIIAIDKGAPESLYEQVYNGYRKAIVDGNLRAGQRIPSTRVLALELGISRMPVLSAYAQLLAEGYFEGRVGSGTFVTSSLPDRRIPCDDTRGPAADAPARPRKIAARATALPKYERPAWVVGRGAFNVSHPALDVFPFKVWSNLVAHYARDLQVAGLQYGAPLGLAPLREAIAAYLRTARAVRCEPEQIMIVSGSQQALDISARVLLDPGAPVWVEEPGYWLVRQILTGAGCRLVPVPVDGDGLDVAAGMRLCRKARAAYIAPSHQYPLGVTMSASRRLELLNWANTTGAWIVEDDYDSEYRYDTLPIASLQGLDRQAQVIYIGTFSKVLFPALRLGYLVIPRDLVARFRRVRAAIDNSPAPFFQAILHDFMLGGHFARHLRRMRAIYAERRRVLVAAIERELGDRVRIGGDRAGMHLVLLLSHGREREIALRAVERGLSIVPLSSCYASARPRSGRVLGYGSTRAADIPDAVRRLRSLL